MCVKKRACLMVPIKKYCYFVYDTHPHADSRCILTKIIVVVADDCCCKKTVTTACPRWTHIYLVEREP